VDYEIFQSESSPDPIKLNPIRSWSTKFLKIISPIQFRSAKAKSYILILPLEAKELLGLFCLLPNIVAIGNPKRHMCNASHCGSKQQ